MEGSWMKENGGDGHQNLIKEYLKPTVASTLNCALIYGYCIQNGKLRMNSGTSNGNDMSDEIKAVFPEVFEKTRNGKNIRQPIPLK